MIKQEKIKDIFEFLPKSKRNAKYGKEEGKYPFFASSNIVLKFVNEPDYTKNKLIIGDGGTASINYADIDFSCSDHCYILKPKNEQELNCKYVYWYLYSNLHILEAGFKGIGIKNISKTFIQDITISLPDRKEQDRIVNLIDKADKVRQKKKQANDKLDEFLKSTFLTMFGDPKINSKQLKKVKIKDLCMVQTGSTPKRDVESYYKDATIPWVKTGEVINRYIYNAEEFISEKAIKETNCKLFPLNTILVAMYGQGLTRGRVGMLKIEASTNQACSAILPSNKINQEFLYNQLKIQYQTLRDYGRGGNQPNLNLDIIKNFGVLVPPIEQQNRFAQIVEKVEAQKQKNEQVIEQMNNLFNSLSQGVFNGEL